MKHSCHLTACWKVPKLVQNRGGGLEKLNNDFTIITKITPATLQYCKWGFSWCPKTGFFSFNRSEMQGKAEGKGSWTLMKRCFTPPVSSIPLPASKSHYVCITSDKNLPGKGWHLYFLRYLREEKSGVFHCFQYSPCCGSPSSVVPLFSPILYVQHEKQAVSFLSVAFYTLIISNLYCFFLFCFVFVFLFLFFKWRWLKREIINLSLFHSEVTFSHCLSRLHTCLEEVGVMC